MRTTSIAKAIENPVKVFDSPQEIVNNDKLSLDKKLEILKSWEQDAIQLETSTGENMTGGEPSRLTEVRAAIDHLEKLSAG